MQQHSTAFGAAELLLPAIGTGFAAHTTYRSVRMLYKVLLPRQ
jgi:hypothetical protein